MNPHNIEIGTKLAVSGSRSYRGGYPGRPQPRLTIFTVARITATQAFATGGGIDGNESVRVRKADLRLIGDGYWSAKIATPEMIAQAEREIAVWQRHRAAEKTLFDLIGKELHQLKLSTEQLERLAAAWAEVKAMGNPAIDSPKESA